MRSLQYEKEFAVHRASLNDDVTSTLSRDDAFYLRDSVIRQAHDLFYALQQSDLYSDTWIVRSCARKMSTRIKSWDKSDSGILNRMKNYEFLEDRLLFAHNWPDGMTISRRDRMKPLELWIHHVNGDTQTHDKDHH